jgi:hypothetical protein
MAIPNRTGHRQRARLSVRNGSRRSEIRNGHWSWEVCIGYGRNEPISLAGDGLYETRLFGIVLQGLPNLADCSVDAVVSIEEGAFSPDPLNNLLPADDLPSLLNQHRQNFRGNALQLKHTVRAAQPIDVEIELEVLAKI